MASRNIAPRRSHNGAANGPSGPAGQPDIGAPQPRFERRFRAGSSPPRRRSSGPARRPRDRPRPRPGRAPGPRSRFAARSPLRTPRRAPRAARRAGSGCGPYCGPPRGSPRARVLPRPPRTGRVRFDPSPGRVVGQRFDGSRERVVPQRFDTSPERGDRMSEMPLRRRTERGSFVPSLEWRDSTYARCFRRPIEPPGFDCVTEAGHRWYRATHRRHRPAP